MKKRPKEKPKQGAKQERGSPARSPTTDATAAAEGFTRADRANLRWARVGVIVAAAALGLQYVYSSLEDDRSTQEVARREAQCLAKLQEAWDLLMGRSFATVSIELNKSREAIEKARQLVREAAATCLTAELDANRLMAYILACEDHTTEAINSLEALAIKHPKSAWIHHDLGILRNVEGQRELAIAHFRRATVLEPEIGVFRFDLGSLLLSTADHNLAREELRLATQLMKPDYSPAFQNLGIAFANLGRVDDAEDAYDRAIQIDPSNVQAMYCKANLLVDTGRSTEAEALYTAVLRINPKYTNARLNLGNCLLARGDLDGAIREYETVIDQDPANMGAKSNLIEAQAQKARD